MVRPEEVHASLPIDDVAHVLGEEAIDGLDVTDKVGRLGRGIPKAHIVEPDPDRNVAEALEIALADRFRVHPLELKPHLAAAQLHCSKLAEHEADVQARTVAAAVHKQADRYSVRAALADDLEPVDFRPGHPLVRATTGAYWDALISDTDPFALTFIKLVRTSVGVVDLGYGIAPDRRRSIDLPGSAGGKVALIPGA